MSLDITITASIQNSRAVKRFFTAIEDALARNRLNDPILALEFSDPGIEAAWTSIKPRPIAKISLHFHEDLLVRLREISYEMSLENSFRSYDVFLRRADLSRFCAELGLKSPNVARALTAMTAFNYKPRPAPPEHFAAVSKNIFSDVNLSELVTVSRNPKFKQDYLALTMVSRISLNALLEFIEAIQGCSLVIVPR